MSGNRRLIRAGVLALFVVLSIVMLSEVLTTIFFAITVAAVVRPGYLLLLDRGLPRWWASLVTTSGVFVGAFALFVPFVYVLYVNRSEFTGFLLGLPDTISIAAFGSSYAVETGSAIDFVVASIRGMARAIVSMAPLLAIKLALFSILVFALLMEGERAKLAIHSVVPPDHRDIVDALHQRASTTLRAIYVLQVALAIITFGIAVPAFWAMGYGPFVSLAVVAATLQFLPIVGPSVLIVILVGYEIVFGNVQGAIVIGIVGLTVIAAVPDVVIRPRIANETARIPSSIYFVGFVGGLLTLGPVGIIAGPLVVALLAESVTLFARELRGPDRHGHE